MPVLSLVVSPMDRSVGVGIPTRSRVESNAFTRLKHEYLRNVAGSTPAASTAPPFSRSRTDDFGIELK